jgi:hypothetical protein
MKEIKKKQDLPVLPIQPTDKPRGDDIAKVAMAVVAMTQACILSPAACISTLRCALDLYSSNAVNSGFDEAVVTECEIMGAKMAESVIASGIVKQRASTPIWTADAGLVGADGKTLAPSASTLASTIAAIRDRDAPDEPDDADLEP